MDESPKPAKFRLQAGFRLGPWTVLPELLRLADGESEQHLEPKQMDLLVYLAERAGEVVAKDEIFDVLWSGAFVADVALKRNVSQLRQMLGDDARAPRFIKTLHKRGYQMLEIPTPLPEAAPVEADAAPAHAARPVDSRPSIAVLPFADMSQEQDQDYFCEGMAEEIINALARIDGLQVSSRTSAFQYKTTTLDSREIAQRLGVRTLLEGSVRKADDRLRITVQLIDAGDGYHLWSERYDRQLADVFAIQEEIAQKVAEALRIKLSAQMRELLLKAPTTHIDAYDYYLRGRKFYFQYGRREIEFARELFARAVEIDPDYVLAHAGIADCWSWLYLYAERSDTWCEQAEAAARRAVELAPDSAQAQASWGVALSLQRRDDEAELAFERAIRLDPHLFEAHYFYARHAFVCGEPQKACRRYEQVMRVRPEDFQAPLLVAQIYSDLGREKEAELARRRGVQLAEEHLALNPDDSRALYMAANGLVGLGEREKGLEWARRAVTMEPEEPMLLYNVGCIYSLAGQFDEAMDTLERAARNGLTQKGWYEHDSNLDPLREHPRFKALLQRLG